MVIILSLYGWSAAQNNNNNNNNKTIFDYCSNGFCPFLSACAVFVGVQTMVWLTVFGTFNMRTDVHACDFTQGLYGHRKRVCTES